MDIPSWAKPGVKVVCVVDLIGRKGWVDYWMPMRPLKGSVYTIRAVALVPEEGCGVQLVEVINPSGTVSSFGNGESGFHISFFKPLTAHTQSQDVALFKPLLTDIREGADV